MQFIKTIAVEGAGMAIYGAVPDGGAAAPGLVVIQHAPGVDTFIQDIVRRLAESGYAAIAPDLYHRQTPQGFAPLERMGQLRDREVIADVNAAIDFLGTETAVDGQRLGILGFCMGGRVAYLMAAANARLRAAAVYYGGNIMKPWGGDLAPFARTEAIGCPVLFHFGEEDTNPSPADRQALDAELARHGKQKEFYTYPHAGHAFMNFTNPERYRAEAAAHSWPRTLDFFARHLQR